jgi:hypothetical protein
MLTVQPALKRYGKLRDKLLVIDLNLIGKISTPFAADIQLTISRSAPPIDRRRLETRAARSVVNTVFCCSIIAFSRDSHGTNKPYFRKYP